MRFEKISENTITCFVSKEEMYEFGVNAAELVDNRNLAEDFLRRVMQEARYEADFKTTGGALSVQIAMLPEGDLSLTISESKDGSLPELDNNFLEQFKKVREFAEKMAKGVQAEEVKEENEDKVPVGTFSLDEKVWIAISRLEECFEVAKLLSNEKIKNTWLYSYKDKYWLRLDIEKDKFIGDVFLALCEYSQEMFLESKGGMPIVEHGKCLIESNAVQVLADL